MYLPKRVWKTLFSLEPVAGDGLCFWRGATVSIGACSGKGVIRGVEQDTMAREAQKKAYDYACPHGHPRAEWNFDPELPAVCAASRPENVSFADPMSYADHHIIQAYSTEERVTIYIFAPMANSKYSTLVIYPGNGLRSKACAYVLLENEHYQALIPKACRPSFSAAQRPYYRKDSSPQHRTVPYGGEVIRIRDLWLEFKKSGKNINEFLNCPVIPYTRRPLADALT